ncbi:MAG: Fic family protein [bacterium]|nr:Fic family protein [bacterium]
MFNPQYKMTDEIVSLLTEIAEAKAVIERAKILPKQELRLRRQAMVRMAHASTGIEGNELNIHQVEALANHKKIDATARDIYEVENYLNALRYISKVVEKKDSISQKVLLKIHQFVTNKTLSDAQSGHFRTSPVYVVRRRLGMPDDIVYTAPEAKKVVALVGDLIKWIQESKRKEINPVIVAGVVHQEIASIHPFVDGNGRTARALATLVLYERGYDFRRLFALEDFYNEDRPSYYQAINIGKNYEERKTDLTGWLTYFVTGFKKEIDHVRSQVITLGRKGVDVGVESQVYLEPEQIKILDFLEGVGRITVKDVVDILNCPKRTAQFNLLKLKKIKLITQVGRGPTTAYIVSE